MFFLTASLVLLELVVSCRVFNQLLTVCTDGDEQKYSCPLAVPACQPPGLRPVRRWSSAQLVVAFSLLAIAEVLFAAGSTPGLKRAVLDVARVLVRALSESIKIRSREIQ
ncbi:hypothetical protein DFH11DRAFT_1723930 [Phellopilus nigrolimitatus]|nr:hypothetical protein DFH11DRAFT_1723930 [Phellopilus nigrolimitatus]